MFYRAGCEEARTRGGPGGRRSGTNWAYPDASPQRGFLSRGGYARRAAIPAPSGRSPRPLAVVRVIEEQFTAMQSLIPTLAVKDIAASLRFYADVLGFESQGSLPDASGELIHASAKRGDVQIMFGRQNPAEPHDQEPLGRGVYLYTTVADDEDIDSLFAHARKAGATIVQEPTDQFWGHRDWTVADPDGFLVVVSKVTRSVSAEEMQEAMMAGAPV